MERPAVIVRDLDISDIQAGLADGSMLVVDVREPHEFAAGHIPGSINLPLSTFDVAQLPDDDRRIVLSCAAGVRSVRALQIANEQGLALSEHYRGGFKDWAASGAPVAVDH